MARGRDRIVRIAKALGDRTRFALLRAISARPGICCRDLVARSDFSQATVSHHLRILSDAGLVEVRRTGQFGLYRLRPAALVELCTLLGQTFSPYRSSHHSLSRTRCVESPLTKGEMP